MSDWISVADRLPEDASCVLGVFTAQYGGGAWPVERPWKPDGRRFWRSWGGPDAQTFPDSAITHWMPLPDPPGDSKGNAAEVSAIADDAQSVALLNVRDTNPTPNDTSEADGSAPGACSNQVVFDPSLTERALLPGVDCPVPGEKIQEGK